MSRLDACLELMAAGDVDVMLLGREANARTVSDAARLWLAGTRVFSPGCVVVRRTAEVHVLSNTDAVMPAGFPVTQLYGVTWNPEKLFASLGAIAGVRDARRVAVDGMNVGANALVARLAPGAEIVDAQSIFGALWATPSPEQAAGVEAATAVARAGLEAMRDALEPGVTPRILRGACAIAFAARGVTTPDYEAVAAPIAEGASTWLPPERTLEPGERIVLRAGALLDGWEGSVARTFVVGTPSTEHLAPGGWDALVAACRAGATAGELRAHGATVVGAGRGVEPWPDDLVLAPGHTVSIELRDTASLRQDVVRV